VDDTGDRKVTRRGFLAASASALGAASVTGVTGPWAERAAGAKTTSDEPRHRPFADAVIEAFDRHRLVAVGEAGLHGLQEHHDGVRSLLTDPRLPEIVDDIVVEFGNALYQSTVDRFVAGPAVGNPELWPVWRNTTQSPLETWDAPVFENVYRTLRAVNWPRSARKQVRVLLGDPPIDWPQVTTRDQVNAALAQRDTHAATVVEREVLDQGRKALILYGAGHVLHAAGTDPPLPPGTVSMVEQRTGEHVYVITTLVPLAGDPGDMAQRLSRYRRGTVIPTAGSWLGAFDAGLILPTGVRGSGGQPANILCDVPLGAVVDAGLYVGQSEDLTVSRPNPTIYLDPAYWDELQRRNASTGAWHHSTATVTTSPCPSHHRHSHPRWSARKEAPCPTGRRPNETRPPPHLLRRFRPLTATPSTSGPRPTAHLGVSTRTSCCAGSPAKSPTSSEVQRVPAA
jgi:hypothetical protein